MLFFLLDVFTLKSSSSVKSILLSVSILFLFCCNIVVAQNFSKKSSSEIVHHTYYVLSYNEGHEQAEWVFYKLTPDMIKGQAVRKNNFRKDPKVRSGSASPSDYVGSGYDRGHLCPAASMKQNQQAIDNTFYMSNISPQIPAFNRGGWRELEEWVRDWALIDSVLYVVTGVIFPDSTKTEVTRIGKNRVTVPTHFYKIVYSPKQDSTIAFIMPNKKAAKNILTYTISVDSIKQYTSFDFNILLK